MAAEMIALPVRVRGSLTQGTIQLMQRIINGYHVRPELITLARRIVSGTKGPQAEAQAIHGWIHGHIAYRRDPAGAEWVQGPLETLKEHAGDCDDLATLAGVLLASLGHQVRAAAVWWTGRDDYSHAVIQDHTAGLTVDPVADRLTPWPPASRRVHGIMEA